MKFRWWLKKKKKITKFLGGENREKKKLEIQEREKRERAQQQQRDISLPPEREISELFYCV